jgi:Flp pilus assembly protein TadB
LSVTYIVYAAMSIFLAVFSYFFVSIIIEVREKRYLNKILDDVNKIYSERQKAREAKFLYEGSTNDKRFIDKIDELVERSRIKTIFPFITSELLIAGTFVLALVSAFLFNRYYGFWLYTVSTFASVILLIVFTLKYMEKRTFNKIDKQLLVYINTLKNLCSSNNDIVVIIEKSIPYVEEPIREYLEQFVFECRKGIPVYKAFRNLEDKVENKRFKQLIKNLAICSKHEANYEKIIKKSKVILKHYFEEKERRKKAVNGGRSVIVITFAMGLFTFNILESFSGNLLNTLKTTLVGNVLLGYFLIVLIYATYKFITLDNLNY